jgi:hypothetical protein
MFLCIIFVIPITQGVLEICQKETPHIFSLFTELPREEHLRNFEDKLIERSFIENSIRPAMLYLYCQLGDAGSKAAKGLNNWLFYRPALDYVTGPYYNDLRIISPVNAEPKEDWNALEAIVDFRDQLAKKDIELIMVPIPAKISVYPDKAIKIHLKEKNQAYANTTQFINELKEHQINVIDLFPYFIEDRINNGNYEKQELYLAHDTHWSGRGVQLAAKIIADYIRRYKWYTESSVNTKYEFKDTVISRYGDIGTMTRILNNKELFGPESINCRQVICKNTGELYSDSKDSRILFLGDSFSRIYQTDEPNGAGLIAHLAYELKMPLTSIVNDGGSSTLVRQQLARKSRLLENKKLVIWEFADRDIRFGLKGWKKIKIIDN